MLRKSADVLCDYDRITGFHEFMRAARADPLNEKENGSCYAASIGTKNKDLNLIIRKFGGMTISAHDPGRLILISPQI
ncbi:MAG: hypothetical protein ACI4WR_04420 [Bulleidia sp.]